MSIHLHLLTSHASVAGAAATLVILLFALRSGSGEVYRLAYGFLFGTAAVALVAFLSGPAAYDALAVSFPLLEKPFVEEHAVLGNAAFIVLILVAVIAFASLRSRPKGAAPTRLERRVLLLGLLVACVLLVWSAHLGGLIRHPEIR